jgi:type I restriction enzyme S subunit
MLYPGDLFVSLKGATKDSEMIGSIARVPPSVSSGRLTQDTVKLVFHEPYHNLSAFLYWLLRTPHYRKYCAGRATGSAVVALSRKDFLSYPVPPLSAGRACIVRLLEDIESKIELNRRTNESLESMARATFKSWFVDFDPVRAKAEGRQPCGMDTETAAIFPDSFRDSALSKIPNGWTVSPIGDLVNAVGGSTPSTEEPSFWGGDSNFCTPKDMASLRFPVLLDTERRVTDAGLERISSGLLPQGTVLLSSRAPIGYLAVTEIPVSVNQGIIAMICDRRLPNLYVLHWARENMETILAQANGTTFLEISKRNFRTIKVVVPPELLLVKFMDTVRPLHGHLVSNLMESESLADIRDTLLSKLISGEIRVPTSHPVEVAAL